MKHGANPGPVPYLTSDEEDELVTFLIQVSEMGSGKTKREVIVIVQHVVEKKGYNTVLFNGEDWWLRFMQHHPVFSLRTADPLFQGRAMHLQKRI